MMDFKRVILTLVQSQSHGVIGQARILVFNVLSPCATACCIQEQLQCEKDEEWRICMGGKEGEKEQICRGEDNREKASPFTAAMLL